MKFYLLFVFTLLTILESSLQANNCHILLNSSTIPTYNGELIYKNRQYVQADRLVPEYILSHYPEATVNQFFGGQMAKVYRINHSNSVFMLKEFFEKIHKNQDLSALQLLKKNESRFTSIRLIKFQDIVNSEFLMLESISGISLLRLSHIKSYDSSKYNRFYKSYLIFLKEAKNWAQSLGFNITETNQYGLPALRFQIYGVEFRLHADNVLIEKSTEDLVLIDPR